ncbi:MAG: sigma-70 family RNA polymerase sigma factor [Rhodobacterales bacterium]|nr:sigma-70 family RNA polymerase sigma factor [Rhodobacterales bacterium]
MRQPSDTSLMGALATGDSQALGTLYLRYGRMVRSLMFRLEPGLSVEQSDDLSQEIFLIVLETAGRYVEQDRLQAWICGIAARHLKGWRRKHWLRKKLLRIYGGEGAGVSQMTSPQPDQQAAARQALGVAIQALSPAFRDVIVLHQIEGLSASEVAAALNISTNTVWTRLHRARQQMRAALDAGEPS